ncbi:MAG: CoA ligase [Bacteroidetes bacterium GWF2_29_10]|nr:MAG: CoA ligase [Bacteroidetes bacterium GWF2_29_10]
MITKELLNPQSIVVIGASNDITKPGGKILKNIIDGNYKGQLHVINMKETEVQGIKSYNNVNELPNVDLAIIAIAAKFVEETIKTLAYSKNTKAYIILSAGFSEVGPEGKLIEDKIVEIINETKGSLIGPNCIGVLNPNYNGIFTLPIPKLDNKGCDFITGSGATAVFILESAIPKGLKFASLFSVGNSAQIGVEEILQHLDETFNENSSKIKLLYLEKIDKPDKLLKHAKSLISKGCKIAAIKAGSSEEGSRAASSHTGALASSDVAVDALFAKAGIIRCYSREELISIASIFSCNEMKGKNIAIITHAGGPAVMLTDALSKGGIKIPHLPDEITKDLLEKLFSGSSVANPIDFLATGTAEQLNEIIDFAEHKLDNIDGIAVIFGTPGLFEIYDAYKVIYKQSLKCSKPIFAVLPSPLTAAKETKYFLDLGGVCFNDEVSMGNAISKVYNFKPVFEEENSFNNINRSEIRNVIDNSSSGYLNPEKVQIILDAIGINRSPEKVAYTNEEAIKYSNDMGYPVVMKVVGPVHKSDVGGVALNINSAENVAKEFERMIKIKDTSAILIQKMSSGTELFVGIKKEEGFGHLIMCGMGGIFIEILKDVSVGLAPIGLKEAETMIQSLKSYKIIKGHRGKDGINELLFTEIIARISQLTLIAPEIEEMDLNPLLGTKDSIIAVDARIRIK